MALKNANVENIYRSIAGIDWDFIFRDTTVDSKVQILKESQKNTFNNYIANKIIKRHYKQKIRMSKLVKSKFKFMRR